MQQHILHDQNFAFTMRGLAHCTHPIVSKRNNVMKKPSRQKTQQSPADRTAGGAAVEPRVPVTIPHTDARLARGIRAGRWVFATGQAGTDYVNGLAPNVVRAERPLNGESHYKREARRIYRNAKEVLAKVGAGIPDVVRVDQYYTTER